MKKLLYVITLGLLLLTGSVTQAEDYGPPTPEQIKKIQEQMQEQAKKQMEFNQENAKKQMEQNREQGKQQTEQLGKWEKIGSQMNGQADGLGEIPEEVKVKIREQLLGGLIEIKKGLIDSEEGVKEMKDGQIKVDPTLETSIQKAKAIFEEANALYSADKLQEAGAKMGELENVGFSKKMAAQQDKNGISLDLINDIRKKIGDTSKNLESSLAPDEYMDAKSDLQAQLNYLDEAEKSLKNGQKKNATEILKKMKASAGDGAAMAEMTKAGIIPTSKILQILEKINNDLTRAEEGLATAASQGAEIPEAFSEGLKKTREFYNEAKKAYDKNDLKEASSKLRELNKLKMEEKLLPFKEALLSQDRLIMILNDGKNGAKALKNTIANATKYGIDPSELAALSQKLDDLLAKAEAALNQKDTETFLTFMSLARDLNVKDKVNEIVKQTALKRAQEILSSGLIMLSNAITSLEGVIPSGNKVASQHAKEILVKVKENYTKARASYDSGDYLNGGRMLNDAAYGLIKISNILRDQKILLSEKQISDIKEILNLVNSGREINNVSQENTAKTGNLLKGVGADKSLEMKMSLMEFNPELLDKMLNLRATDQKMLENTIKNVMPLLPESERQDMLEGKINLLEEVKSADKTVAIVKGLKDLNSPQTLTSLQETLKKIQSYNFPPEIAAKLEEKIAKLNEGIQAGAVKTPQDIKAYVSVLKAETEKAMSSSQAEKTKDGLQPIKNIDDNNALFNDLNYLRADGAITPDKKGEINVNQKVTKTQLIDMINKTMDEKTKASAPKNMKIAEVAKTVANSYGISATNFNFSTPAGTTQFLNLIGVNMNSSDLNKTANLGQVADILAAADQRWGMEK